MRERFKQTEIGMFPVEWDVDSLVRFWTVTDCKHVTAHFVANGFPIASIMEVQNRFVYLGEAKQTTPLFYTLLTEGGRKPKPGDLILSRNATVGEVAQVAEWHPPFAMGQDVCLLRKRVPTFSTTYLQAVFFSPVIAKQLADLMVGSTFKRVNVRQIKSLKIPMPDPTEQDAIAEALSDVDALIESLEQLISKKRDVKKAAMQKLLTGQTRLPGFRDAWEEKRLGDLLKVRHGKGQRDVAVADGKFPILASGGEIGRTNTALYSNPSVLIGRKGTIDSPQYAATPFWTVDTLFFTEISEDADPKFVFYAFTMIPWRSYNEASGVPSLNAKTIENIEVWFPKLPEQIAIAEVLSDMDAELAALEQREKKVQALNQAMAQELLTGRTRLNSPKEAHA